MQIKNILIVALTFSSMGASANELEYIGSCTWGSTSIKSCTHAAGNALMSIYQETATGEYLVHNRVTANDENFCEVPLELPADAELVTAGVGESGAVWVDKGAKQNSRITFVGTELNKVQIATNAFNGAQQLVGKKQLAYPPCFLVKTPQ